MFLVIFLEKERKRGQMSRENQENNGFEGSNTN